VGADRLGDVLGAQVVGLIIYFSQFPRTSLLTAAVVTGVVTLIFASRLPASYRASLEDSLLARAPDLTPEPTPRSAKRWMRLYGSHSFGQTADHPSMSLLRIPVARDKPKPVSKPERPVRSTSPPDSIVEVI